MQVIVIGHVVQDDDVAARIKVVDIWQLELLQSASLDEWIAVDCSFKGNEAGPGYWWPKLMHCTTG